jgi:hypothetical protein
MINIDLPAACLPFFAEPASRDLGLRMTESMFHTPLLARDQKLFLELSSDEAVYWVTRVFEHLRPYMRAITPLLIDEEDINAPLDLEGMLVIGSRRVREVAVEMANVIFTPERQQQIFPMLSAYCDELLAEGRALDATFVQQGLIGILNGQPPAQNTLLVEVCQYSIFHQVSLINRGPRSSLHSH